MSDNGTDGELSPRQNRLLRALLCEKDTLAAAKAAHVSRRTAWRWLAQPAFKAALSQQQDVVLGEATRHAASLLAEALDVLSSIMHDAVRASPSARVAAARAILDCGLRYAELCDLAQRVSELEKAVTREHPSTT